MRSDTDTQPEEARRNPPVVDDSRQTAMWEGRRAQWRVISPSLEWIDPNECLPSVEQEVYVCWMEVGSESRHEDSIVGIGRRLHGAKLDGYDPPSIRSESEWRWGGDYGTWSGDLELVGWAPIPIPLPPRSLADRHSPYTPNGVRTEV